MELKPFEKLNNPENKELHIAPKTVDFNVIGTCNLNCEWCWGPDHKLEATLSANDWIEIGKQLKKLGTENIVITGGEPLLRKDMLEILEGLKSIGMRVTLSTNTINLLQENNLKSLKFIDEIGIPLDGSTMEVNNIMRKGNIKAFDSSIQAIKYVQEKYPAIKITLRTVLSQKNLTDTKNIPQTLNANGIDLTKFRWKLYQITPTGPRKEQTTLGENNWLISEEETQKVVSELKNIYPQMTISVLLSKEHNARYLHIDPIGKITTLTGKNPQHEELGNVFNDKKIIQLKNILIDLDNSEKRVTDTLHGTDNF